GLAMSVVGIPLAILTGMGTVACASGTVVFASVAVKHFHNDFKEHDHIHSNNKIETSITNQVEKNIVKPESDTKGSFKPLFTPPPSKTSYEIDMNNIDTTCAKHVI